MMKRAKGRSETPGRSPSSWMRLKASVSRRPLRIGHVHRREEDVPEERARVVEEREQREEAPRALLERLRGLLGEPLVVGAARVELDHVVVHGDVARLVAVDELHRRVAHLVVHEVVERAQERHVEEQLAGRDVGVRDVGRQVVHRLHERPAEAHEVRVELVALVAVHVVVLAQALRHGRVPLLVDHEGVEDRGERRVARHVALHLEELAGQQLDAAHVHEVLADRDLVLARELPRPDRPIEVADAPLVPAAHGQHAFEIHGRRIASLVGRSQP
ncbi:MAG: hypothetical protein M5U28_35840 [Sandaracinaceae bacterium]|nr:hypothetical protein [Sandaracinaceae bacterium]